MDNKKKKFNTNRVAAYALSGVMLASVIPYNVFATEDKALEAANQTIQLQNEQTTGIATRDAEGDIPSGTITNDAPNAVHAFVGVQTGGDANLPLAGATGQQFKPIQGVKAYFQWFEDGGYVSPVYSAVSDANGRLNIACKPYVASDGKIIKFDADTTVSGGHEKYRFWVDQSTIPVEYQLQYITGEQVVFPQGIATITQGGSGSDTPKNTHENWKILLMQKPKADMHKNATETQKQANGGYIKGKVSWDYNSPSGGVQWKYIAHQTTPANGVTVKASYLSDYAMKKIYSDEMAVKLSLSGSSAIRGRGWTSKLEGQLQDEIRKQMKGEEDKWIAETVTANTNDEGDYILQFKGTWGYKQNSDVANGYTEEAGKWGWTQEAIDRLGTVADNASDGSFNDAALNYNEKHINLDWLFVSTEGTENLRVMTPYNNNWYTAMNSDWGIHSGWSGLSNLKEFSVGVTNIANRSMKSDFILGINKVNFNITNFDSGANTAIPGDCAQTSTTGLPYSYTSDKFRIVWYDDAGNVVKTGTPEKPSSTGMLPSLPLDTNKDVPGGVTKTTEFTAKLYRVDSNNNNAELIAVDSFTVEVSHLFISRYDEVSIVNPKASDKEMEGAIYSADNLPNDLKIDSSNGTISGKAETSGLYNSIFKTILNDKNSGEIKGERVRYIAVTDSPLASGQVGVPYSQDVKPVPEKDPKDKAYIYKMKSVNFISGKEVEGLKVEGDATNGFKITGTPKEEAKATEDVGQGLLGPNVEVIYDIYKSNDQGEEILIKENHKDLVPLIIESTKENSSYEPEYKAVDGKVGEEAKVAAPKFLDEKSTETQKPEANPQPTGMTFALADGYTGTAKIDAKTGAITYTPVDGDAEKAVKIPVVVKYSDGSTDNVNAVINVTKNATTADKVKELGGLNPQTIKVWKGDKFDWAKGVVAADDNNSKEVKALLDAATITDKAGRNSNEAGKSEGTLLVTFADGSSVEVPKQMLIVSDHIVTIDPNDPNAPIKDDLPSDKIEVKFVKSTGVKEVKTTGTTYVKPGITFKDSDFPEVTVDTENGYDEQVTWTPANRIIDIDKPGYVKRGGYFRFVAKATLEDIIDRTNNPEAPTPDGYVRVTFTNGDGVNDIANNKVYDVKSGTALTADKYPEVTAKDGYENPTWSVAPGTAITADNATITATATMVQKDNEKYEATGETITKNYGEATEEAEVLGKVTTDYPADAEKQPTKALKAGQTLPDGKTSGNFDVVVEVTYPDGTKDEATVTVKVAKSNAETYEPTVEKETVKKGGTVDLTDNVTNKDDLPEGTTVKDVTPEGAIDTETPGDYTGKVEVTYPDGSKETVDVPVTVTEADNETYEATGGEIDKEFGKATEEAEVLGKVTTDYPADAEKQPTKALKAGQTLPDGKTSGNFDVVVEVTYPDGTKDEATVTVKVAKSNAETYEPTVEKETVKKGGTVDLTDNVTNKDDLPEGTTVKDVTPEGTIDTKVPGDYTGKVEVTYPDGSKETVDVPVTVTDTTAPEKDADKYQPEVAKEEVKKGGTVDLKDNVTNLDKLPKGTTVKDVTPEGTIDTKVPGDYTGKVEVTYPDGSKETVDVPVTVTDTTAPEKDSDKYEPTVSKEEVNKGGKVDLTDNVTNLDKLPEGTKVEDVTPEGAIDTETPGDYTGKIKVTYPDGSSEEKEVPVTVKDTTTPAEKDADKYEPTVKKEEVEKGGKVDLTDNVTNLDKLPEGTKVEDVTPEGAIDTETPGDYTGKIKVTYPDGSSEEKEVPVTVKDTTPTKTDAEKYPAQDPNKTKVEDKNNLTDDEKDKVKEEVKKANPEAKDVTVDDKGNAELTYPDGSKNTIPADKTVTEKENGSTGGDDGYRPGHGGSDIFDRLFKRHDYTPTYPVKTVVPEKTEYGTPVRDTLWYVFHINEFEYEVVRNGVVTKRLMDVTPVLKNGRTMLPLRYVAEALQADVKWDAKTRTATFTKDGLTASIQIDSDEIVLSNGKTVKMDSKPLNINDRILVSVTNVANVFGLTNGNTKDNADQDIEWEQEDKSATIYIRR